MLDEHTHHSANIPLRNTFTFYSITWNYKKLLYKIINTGFEFFMKNRNPSIFLTLQSQTYLSLSFYQAGHVSPSSSHNWSYS